MSDSCVLYLHSAVPSDARIREQEEILKKYAAQRGYKVSRIFSDNGKSGATIEGRDGLSSALDYIKAHSEVKALIVEDADRLARNISDHRKLMYFLYSHNVGLLMPGHSYRYGVSADVLTGTQELMEARRRKQGQQISNKAL